MEAAHRAGIKTNATMLYGHVENYEQRVDHLIRLRELQDKTKGFQAFIPLAYHPKNTEIGGVYSSGIDDLKTIAVSRLVLDNFSHIKAYWIMLGENFHRLHFYSGLMILTELLLMKRSLIQLGSQQQGTYCQ